MVEESFWARQSLKQHRTPPAAGLTGVGKTELQLRSGPRLPDIPSAGRNLKSETARLGSQCRTYIVTKSENNVRTLYVGFTL